MDKKTVLKIAIVSIFIVVIGITCLIIVPKPKTHNVVSEKEVDKSKPSDAIEQEPSTVPILQEPEYEQDKNTEDLEIDAILAAGIRAQLMIDKDAKLTRKMLESITALYIWDYKLETLKGIKYLKNLERLGIGVNHLTDITELTELKKIKQIFIDSGYIKEIPDFSSNFALTELQIPQNSITDIGPILKIPNIKFVDLQYNFIKSISKVKDMQTLDNLNLSGNVITDYALIKDNKKLQKALPLPYDQYMKVENKAKEIVGRIITEDMSEIEKEAAIHEYIVDNIEFSDRTRPYRVDGYYSIIENYGVCGDYAEAMRILGATAGLDVIEVSSSTHAWNIIKLDGEYYHIDTLWDDSENTIKYFNRSTEYILSLPHHEYDLKRFPTAKNDMPKTQFSHLLKATE